MGPGVRSTCWSPSPASPACSPRLRAQQDHREGDTGGQSFLPGGAHRAVPRGGPCAPGGEAGRGPDTAGLSRGGPPTHPPHRAPEVPRSWLACRDTHVPRAPGNSLLGIPGSRALAEPQQPLPQAQPLPRHPSSGVGGPEPTPAPSHPRPGDSDGWGQGGKPVEACALGCVGLGTRTSGAGRGWVGQTGHGSTAWGAQVLTTGWPPCLLFLRPQVQLGGP